MRIYSPNFLNQYVFYSRFKIEEKVDAGTAGNAFFIESTPRFHCFSDSVNKVAIVCRAHHGSLFKFEWLSVFVVKPENFCLAGPAFVGRVQPSRSLCPGWNIKLDYRVSFIDPRRIDYSALFPANKTAGAWAVNRQIFRPDNSFFTVGIHKYNPLRPYCVFHIARMKTTVHKYILRSENDAAEVAINKSAALENATTKMRIIENDTGKKASAEYDSGQAKGRHVLIDKILKRENVVGVYSTSFFVKSFACHNVLFLSCF